MAERDPIHPDVMVQLATWYAAQAEAEDRLADSLEAQGLVQAARNNRQRAIRHRQTVKVLEYFGATLSQPAAAAFADED